MLPDPPRTILSIYRNTYIWVFDEPIYYGTKLDHILITQDQTNKNGIFLWDNQYDGIINIEIDIDDYVNMPSHKNGTKTQFTTRILTE